MQTLDIGKFTFYWRMTAAPNTPPNPVPDLVDLSLEYREDLQLIIQTRSEKTAEYLECIYQENYNVGYLQEGHALAESYGGDFLAYVEKNIQEFNPEAKSVAEVGAGGCYLLNYLKKKGFKATAIDPSPTAKVKGEEFGIEVIPTFYPAPGRVSPSDMILHYDVLEHVDNPVQFLKDHKSDLLPGGLIIFAVPDCTPYILCGDVSMLLHEHLNYYDKESIRNVIEAAGFEALSIEGSGHGSVLYCTARAPQIPTAWVPKSGSKKFDDFVQKYKILREEVSDFIREATKPGCSLGCYIPLRTFPYLAQENVNEGLRFFDDNPGIHNQYFDGYNQPVENMNDLWANPPTHLLILSYAFGEKIREKVLSGLADKNIKVYVLKGFPDKAAV